jgi:hypothetical protein
MAFADGAPRNVVQGIGPVKIALSGTVAEGDLIGVTSSTWVGADGASNIPARFVSGEAGVSGDVITAFRGAVVEGYTGGTLGEKIYLGATAGDYTSSASSLSQVVGFMLSDTSAYIEPLWTTDPAG